MSTETPQAATDATETGQATTQPGTPPNVTEVNSEGQEAKRRAVLRIVFLLPV